MHLFEAHAVIDDGPQGVDDVSAGSGYANEFLKAIWGCVSHGHSSYGYDGVELVRCERQGTAQFNAKEAFVYVLRQGLPHHFVGHVDAEKVSVTTSE